MGRYTTVQTYTDKDSKVASIPYEKAKSSNDANGKSSSSSAPSGEKKERFRFNKVDNVTGSSAGAGSGDFHMYRATRQRENDRMSKLVADKEKKEAEEEFQRKRQIDQLEFEARTKKRAEKRKRKKLLQKLNKESKKEEQEEANKKDEGNREEILPTSGGVPEIPNDGSFLETMLKKMKK